MSIPFDGSFDGPLDGARIPARTPHPWTRVSPSSPLALSLETRLRPEFGHVHPAASLSVSLLRTPRVPGEFRGWPLHRGLGSLPMARVSEIGPSAPAEWHEFGGVAAPMYRSEAAWIRFRSPAGYPFAVKVVAGGTNAVTGEPWTPGLAHDPPNHMVVPAQGWIDGVRLGDGRVRQFTADAFGTRDGQPCGARLQLIVTPLKGEVWARRTSAPSWPRAWRDEDGLGPDVWDESATQTCVVRLVPADCWEEIAREPVPHAPLDVDVYRASGLPRPAACEADARIRHTGLRLVR